MIGTTSREHDEGDPYACREHCPGPHIGDGTDIPECCPDCGGNGRACWPSCNHSVRRYEPFEGRTGAQEAADE